MFPVPRRARAPADLPLTDMIDKIGPAVRRIVRKAFRDAESEALMVSSKCVYTRLNGQGSEPYPESLAHLGVV